MDILNNVLNMGTSNATFYLGKQNDARDKLTKWLKEFSDNPAEKIKNFIDSLIEGFKETAEEFKEKINGVMEAAKNKSEDDAGGSSTIINNISDLIKDGLGEIKDYVKDFIVAKYKIQFMGIISALTGAPSTPWHVTVGNPLRPIFCSGDMECTNVTMDFGPQLSFNDLPTYIKVTFTLTSARNLGLQEIFSKFNTGSIRTTNGEYLSSSTESFWTDNNDIDEREDAGVLINSNSSSGDRNKTDNKDDNTDENETKVSPLDGAVVLPEVTITPGDIESQVNVDPNSEDGAVIKSGSDDESQRLREDNQIETNGELDGFVDQKEDISDVPNEGVNAETIKYDDINPNWEVGKRISRGGYNQTGIRVEWEVRNDMTPGRYEAFVIYQNQEEDLGSFPDKSSAIETAKDEAFYKFTELGGTVLTR